MFEVICLVVNLSMLVLNNQCLATILDLEKDYYEALWQSRKRLNNHKRTASPSFRMTHLSSSSAGSWYASSPALPFSVPSYTMNCYFFALSSASSSSSSFYTVVSITAGIGSSEFGTVEIGISDFFKFSVERIACSYSTGAVLWNF